MVHFLIDFLVAPLLIRSLDEMIAPVREDQSQDVREFHLICARG